MPSSYNDAPRVGLTSRTNGNAVGTYKEEYQYDTAGNFGQVIHRGSNPADPGWTRVYTYNEASLLDGGQKSNRLTRTTINPNAPQPLIEDYSHDLHGNMIRMPHLPIMHWDFKDQLLMTQRQAVNKDDADGNQHQGERTYYVYDSSGHRLRKVTENQNGSLGKQRIYLGWFEVFREYRAGEIALQRESLHVTDDRRRICLIEAKTASNAAQNSLPITAIRYQFGNHLGSACLELDEEAAVISYEEYYPYGSTSYQAGRNGLDVSAKRYRYTGKERDEETGLYYHRSRYAAPWLGRWASCDPKLTVDALNLYLFVRANPINLIDPSGTEGVYDDQAGVCRSGCGPGRSASTSSATVPLADQPQAGPTAVGKQVIPLAGLNVADYGNVADFMRDLYNTGTNRIFVEAQQLLKAGRSENAVARWVVDQRNALKLAIRDQGPKLFRAANELRNWIKYGNKVGPSYGQIRADKLAKIAETEDLAAIAGIGSEGTAVAQIDREIIQGVTKTSSEFNAAGSRLRLLGKAGAVAGFVLTALSDSPESLAPLPISQEKEVAIEKARLHFGIPAYVNIDEHGHRKSTSYEQIDSVDLGHVGGELAQETDEVLWRFGVPLTYHATLPDGSRQQVTWTVPGR
jgi:RHS repeat-associated protein